MILAAALLALRVQNGISPPIALAWRSGLLCAPVTIGEGKPLWFLLDTGAHRSFLTKRAYARLVAAGAKVDDERSVVLSRVRIGEYPLGSLRLADEAEEYAHSVEGPADGYLGMDILSRYCVGIDLREKTLRLWPAGTVVRDWFTAPPDSLVSVPLRERAEGWCVPVEVGNLTVPMVLDTGAADTFMHTDVAALLKGARKAKRDSGTLPFYDGLHRVRTYTIPTVGLGGVLFGERNIGVASVPRMVGLLGRDLLSPLKVLLDYPGERATFAGLDGEPTPVLDGPQVTLGNGVVVRWPRGVTANAPPGCAYTLPTGYREVFKADESVDLVPKGGSPPND